MLQASYFTSIQLNNVPVNSALIQPQRLNQAPVTFNNLPIHNELVNYQSSFVVSVLNASASKATQTPGRMYQWNLLCENNGNNKELMDTVILAANYTALGLAKGAYNNVEQAAQASIEFIVEARAAYIVAVFPDLLKMYPQSNQEVISRMAQQYVNTVNELTNYINSVVLRATNVNSFGGNGFNNQTQQQQSGFGPARQSAFGGVGFGVTGRSAPAPAPSGGFGVNVPTNVQGNSPSPFVNQTNRDTNVRSNNTGVFTTGNNAQSSNVDIAGIVNLLSPTEKANLANKHQAFLDERNKERQSVVQEVEIKREDSVDSSVQGNIWQPSAEQPFVPARTNSHKLNLVKRNGKIVYEVINMTKEEIDMEREAHRTTITSAIQRGTSLKVEGKAINSRGDFLKISLDTIANTHDNAHHATEEDFSKNLNSYFLGGYSLMEESETSMDAAINKARQMKVLTTDLNQLGAHRIDFDLDKMFVIPEKEFTDFDKVLKASSLEQLAAKMKAALLDDQHSLAFNSALIQLDAYIKCKLIEVVRCELSLTEYDGMDSFVDDYADLMDDIRVSHPNAYNILKRNEKDFITRYLSLSDKGELVGNGESKLINAIIKQRSSVTVVDFLYYELDIQLVHNKSNVVHRELFPKIYDFLDELISNDYIKDGEIYYANHWLVTTDNEIIRIYRSQLDNATILMAKV